MQMDSFTSQDLRKSSVGTGLRFSKLSPSRQLLLRLCQAVNFGFIQELEIRDSEPVFSPPPIVLVDLKLDGEAGPRPEIELADFALCREACRLMELLDKLRNSKIDRIEVRAGIPRRVILKSWPSDLLE
jgi:hypothetical protein